MSLFLTHDHEADIKAEIAEWLCEHPMPKVVSLDDETHLFVFNDEWSLSPLIFVNRNGNYQRLIWINGTWHAFATWRTLFPTEDWEFKGLKDQDPGKVIAKISVGPPRGHNEGLCYLPKEATRTTRRVAAYRHELLTVNHANDAFSLSLVGGLKLSPMFGGKPWLSADAVEWVKRNMSQCAPLSHDLAAANPYTSKQRQADLVSSLEDNPLFGMWG